MFEETGEERVIEALLPPLSKAVQSLKAYSRKSEKLPLVDWVSEVIQTVLGFNGEAGYTIHSVKNRGPFQMGISRGTSLGKADVLVGVLEYGGDMEHHDYFKNRKSIENGVVKRGNPRWGILTNGPEWRLYDLQFGCTCVVSSDLRNLRDKVDDSETAVENSAWELLGLTRRYWEDGIWEDLSEGARSLSPDFLARELLSIPIIRKISNHLRDDHKQKVSLEVLTERISELLEMGLNEAVGAWSTKKTIELEKFIRRQKKLARQARLRTRAERLARYRSGDSGKVLPFRGNRVA